MVGLSLDVLWNWNYILDIYLVKKSRNRKLIKFRLESHFCLANIWLKQSQLNFSSAASINLNQRWMIQPEHQVIGSPISFTFLHSNLLGTLNWFCRIKLSCFSLWLEFWLGNQSFILRWFNFNFSVFFSKYFVLETSYVTWMG